MNPGASIKDRVAKHISQHLDQKQIPRDALLIVAGPGNLAISLAMLQRRLLCLVPERTSADRIRLLKASGITDIVRTLDGALPGSSEHPVEIGKRIMQQRTNAIYIDEETGDWDLSACYQELADEIIEQTDGHLDALVLGVDTGNAATHLSQALKQKLPDLQVVGVEPANSAISEDTQTNPLAKRWLCEDIGRVYAPRALHQGCIDMWVQISDSVAYSMARRLIGGGILAGPSSGAAVAAARMYAVANLQPGQRALVIMGDTARNYSDTLLNDDWLLAHDLFDARMLADLQAAQMDKYRAASIEDLQLPAAVTVSESEHIANAVGLMLEHDFSQVPVTGQGRKLIGYLTLAAAQTLLANGVAKPGDPVRQFMLRFAGPGKMTGKGNKRRQYWLITPETPLHDLSRFFEVHSVAFVTDYARKFCLGIATKQDLLNFLARRNASSF
ncbi:hypothetical protein FBU59_004237 [Linderina macrospora]|uniref:Uncharacterized protein n=1 Tax=Linderina macrospora TaxID=4868 RepID=A0ACC1J648_9FUNG|nr:hypothetical protein FBU59_004237 [Linderina macrospora]